VGRDRDLVLVVPATWLLPDQLADDHVARHDLHQGEFVVHPEFDLLTTIAAAINEEDLEVVRVPPRVVRELELKYDACEVAHDLHMHISYAYKTIRNQDKYTLSSLSALEGLQSRPRGHERFYPFNLPINNNPLANFL
jgi:hypothetical protein